MSKNFNTNNSEQLVYTANDLQLTVMGGIKIDGLDRMRVTLKAEATTKNKLPLRHSLDLYNEHQLQKYIRRIAEKLEIRTSSLEIHLSELTNHLEEYRLAEITRQATSQQTKAKQLTATEKKEATDFLKQNNLLAKTNELIGKSGVVGEENNRLLMYLIFTSRKRQQPLHVLSLGASGMGKTHLQEKVGELIPQEDKIEVTTLSDNAFYYFGQRELQHKLILIEDLDGLNSLYALRELQSKKKISKTIARKNSKGDTQTIHLVVEGPVSVSACTTKEQIYEDNSNRNFLIYLDESLEQDQRIMEYQRSISAGKIDFEEEQEAKEILQNCQRILKPVEVVNPFAEQLKIPAEILKPRRTNTHYLQFIEAVTFYHQYQRKQQVNKETGVVYIETTLEDIKEANQLLKEILLRKSDELTGACRNYFEELKTYLKSRPKKGETKFTNREMALYFKKSLPTIKRYHIHLYNQGYIKIVGGQKFTKGYEYEVENYSEYTSLQDKIYGVLDAVLTQIGGSLAH